MNPAVGLLCLVLAGAMPGAFGALASGHPVSSRSLPLANVPYGDHPRQMHAWTPNSRYGGHAFGFMPDPRDVTTRDTPFVPFLAARETLLPWTKRYSPFEHANAGDPPIYLTYATPPAPGQDAQDPTHTANFGVLLRERLQAVGVECELVYPGAPDVKHPQREDFLIAKLLAGRPGALLR